MVNVTLKDGTSKAYAKGTTILEIAKDLSEGLARNACCGKIDGEVADLRDAVEKDCTVEICTFDSPEGKKAYRHTASHIMAQAVKRLYPETKLAIGPATDEGFYYDFDIAPLDREALDKIEKEMKKIAKDGKRIVRHELTKAEALEMFKDDPYKIDLISRMVVVSYVISCYTQGDFTDLCRGPHVDSVKELKYFKLLKVSGAYWKNDAKNHMLQRIYGVCFETAESLEQYLNELEERKQRDHRKIGKEQEIFMNHELVGAGMPIWLPNGAVIRKELENYIYEKERNLGYEHVYSPCVGTVDLYKTSGHWDHYKENMYTTVIDEQDYAIKPMNCPGGVLVYKSEPRSYRDLPLRLAEVGLVHRHEKSGQLHGLMRVRCFNQDDAHIFMTPEQIKDEIKGVANLIDQVYKLFGFKYHVELSTRPEDSMGSDEDWEVATEGLRGALDDLGLDYVVNEGDGAFYGPKIDFHLEDSIGRTWQCGTIQLDFQLPQRFELEYTGADGEKHRPIMIHRVVYGSVERFIGILIEHFAGAFPTWLAPVQVKVLPISDKYADYGKKVLDALHEAGIRAEMDTRSEKIGYKIREAQGQKIPYMLIAGAKEEEAGLVSVRSRFAGDEGQRSLEQFIADIKEEIASRVNRPVTVETKENK